MRVLCTDAKLLLVPEIHLSVQTICRRSECKVFVGGIRNREIRDTMRCLLDIADFTRPEVDRGGRGHDHHHVKICNLKNVAEGRRTDHWWIQGDARDVPIPIQFLSKFLPQTQGFTLHPPPSIWEILDPPRYQRSFGPANGPHRVFL